MYTILSSLEEGWYIKMWKIKLFIYLHIYVH